MGQDKDYHLEGLSAQSGYDSAGDIRSSSTLPFIQEFFASNEIEIFLAWTLLHYDIRLPPGVTERPKNLMKGVACIPDPSAKVEFKSRTPELRLSDAAVDQTLSERNRASGRKVAS